MSKLDLEPINNWMHRNARELDLASWKCLFMNGNAEEVADALLQYQNEDGGFSLYHPIRIIRMRLFTIIIKNIMMLKVWE